IIRRRRTADLCRRTSRSLQNRALLFLQDLAHRRAPEQPVLERRVILEVLRRQFGAQAPAIKHQGSHTVNCEPSTHSFPASIWSISCRQPQKVFLPCSFTFSAPAASAVKRSGRPKCENAGCTVVENHAMAEIARASNMGSQLG